ncbi:MAG: sensor domain-containing diguanylate cyclase [Acidobacteria bacterium]|nr:sensor domain-containing diguanylate cyclase [Acidobacteriota bacterium]
MTATHLQRPIVFLLVLVGYTALGWLGLLPGGARSDYTVVVWPASGLALAALLGFGRSLWPAVLSGALITMFAASGSPLWSLMAAAGLTLEAVVGAALVERFARGTGAFLRPETIFRVVVIAAVAAAPITATMASVATVLVGPAFWTDLAYLWMTWWLASLAGTLVAAPLILLWASTPVTSVRVLSVAEAVAMLAAITGVSLVVFAGRFPTDVQNYPLEFLCVPFLLWAAFRQGRRTVSLAAAVLCGVAAWGTMRDYGPFVRDSQNEAIVLVQAYIAVMGTMAAVLAAVVAEHRRAEAQLRELATTDPLTGLANYRRLLEVLRGEIARSNRTGRPFTVLFLDMNGLKRINDKYGHLAGSRALCRLAETLKQSCRTIDTPTRFGGDEFAIVLPETPEAGGYIVLRRISERLAASEDEPAIAVSGGVAVFPRDGSSPTQLLRAADKVLYESRTRSSGRRRHADAAAEPEEVRRTGTLF